jgi:hypothetical protein
MDDRNSKLNRRDLFRMIGLVAGGSVMYQAMTSLGYAADSQYAQTCGFDPGLYLNPGPWDREQYARAA